MGDLKKPPVNQPKVLTSDFKDLKNIMMVATEKKAPPVVNTPINIPSPQTTSAEKPATHTPANPPIIKSPAGETSEKKPGEVIHPPVSEEPPVNNKPAAADPGDFSPAPPVQAPAPAKVVPVIPYKDQAKQLVMFLDNLQVLTLPWLYQKGIFSKKEYLRLRELKEKIKTHTGDPAKLFELDGDLKIYEKYIQFKKLKDDLPFSPEEVALLQDPLAAVMEKYNYTIGPEALLMTAVTTVMAPRLIPLLARFE